VGKKQESDLRHIRDDIDGLNRRLLDLLNERASLVEKIRPVKLAAGHRLYDPVREADQLERLMLANEGPLSNGMVEQVFRAVFQAALSQQMEGRHADAPLVMERGAGAREVKVGDAVIGGSKPVVIAGPCSVEDEAALDRVAGQLKELGIKFLRGGAFKPRSSPYSFQGLGMEGIKMLSKVAARHGLKVVSELTDPALLDDFLGKVDVIQVGANNMFNYDLLKKLGQVDVPVLLKRHFSARMDEWMLAAEYLYAGGNRNVVLCERGIRTFETATRYSLDISAVGLVKSGTELPIIVDVSHAAGRRDLLLPLAKAALAAGADGLMVEVHERPEVALSDGAQQLNLDQFAQFMADLQPFLE
jgi:3-deoxy-7-phosphoheptulonate synthase / chorismate mutase